MAARFHKLKFGYASAEVEAAEEPALLLQGFLDVHDVAARLLDGREFLLLGAKGSGKSATGLHLTLDSQRRYDLFVTAVSAAPRSRGCSYRNRTAATASVVVASASFDVGVA